MNQKGSSYWAIIIVIALFAGALIFVYWPKDSGEDYTGTGYLKFLHSAQEQALDLSEKAKIEKWIVDNKLNQYGDSADTLYAGGTPLFDESTGEMVDRYEYILKNHPHKPWQ